MNVYSVQDLHEKRARGDEFLLIDVRTAEELAIASLDGAYHIPLDALPMRLEEVGSWKEKEVVCMCHHGMRSARAQQILAGGGFTNVYNLTGGIHAWSVQVDPAVPRY